MIDTGAGVIDADYRGIVFVLLFNLSDKDFEGVYTLNPPRMPTSSSGILSSQLKKVTVLHN